MLSSFTVAALDLVFPALCPVCDTTLGAGRRDPLCGTCWSAISRLGAPWCDRCGAASIVTEAEPPRVAPRLACALCAHRFAVGHASWMDGAVLPGTSLPQEFSTRGVMPPVERISLG